MVKYDYFLEHHGLNITFNKLVVDEDNSMWFENDKGNILCFVWKDEMQLEVDFITRSPNGECATIYFNLIPKNNKKGGR